MKQSLLCILAALLLAVFQLRAEETWVRVNLSGYLPADVKVAVAISESAATSGAFVVRDALTDQVVLRGQGRAADASKWALQSGWRLDFSALQAPGSYYIVCDGATSPVFRIGTDVYDSLADFLLTYTAARRFPAPRG